MFTRSNAYRFTNLLLSVILPAYGVYSGEATVFYILYLFWWQEVLAALLDKLFARNQPPDRAPVHIGGKFFILAIHLVFIIVFFGFVADWGSDDRVVRNVQIAFFRDWFFNLNIAGIIVNEWWHRFQWKGPAPDASQLFNARMIILHVSIIFGGVVFFFVLQRFPQVFNSANPWRSVLIVLPFLLLKAVLEFRRGNEPVPQVDL